MRPLSSTKYSSMFLGLILITWAQRGSGQVTQTTDLAFLAPNYDSPASIAHKNAHSRIPVQIELASSKANGAHLELPESALLPARSSPQSVINKLGDSSPIFIENKGQFDKRVKFQVKNGNKTLWLTSQGIVFDMVRTNSAPRKAPTAREDAEDKNSERGPALGKQRNEPIPDEYDRLVFSQDFVVPTPNPRIEGLGTTQGIYNYFFGNDPSKWVTNVKGYSQVIYHDVWPGVDLKLYAKGHEIEEDFLVHRGAATDKIKIACRGIIGLAVDPDGDLAIKTAFGDVTESTPKMYQEVADETVQVAGKFKLLGENSYTFLTQRYSRDHVLLIDPTLGYSTFLGGSSGSTITSLAVDSLGNAYVTGWTFSQDFPVTPNSFQTVPDNSQITFVSKLNPSGDSLAYSTYLGGSGAEIGNGIAVDNEGNAYVSGLTTSSDFPTTPNPLQSQGANFLTKLGNAGNTLIYSTYFSTSGKLAVDNSENVYIADGSSLVSKINNRGNAIAYSYNVAGRVLGIAVDNQGAAYVTGNTQSKGGTSIVNGCPFGDYAFVSKIDFNGQSTDYLMTIGGSTSRLSSNPICNDSGTGIAVDSSGDAYVTGYTSDNDFPVTQGAFQTTVPLGPSNAFILKVNPFGTNLIYSSYLGGNGHEGNGLSGDTPCSYNQNSIGIDASGNAYVVGCTSSTDFPVTPDALQSSHSVTMMNGFFSVFDPSGSNLLYSTYLGGSGLAGNYGNVGTIVSSIAMDPSGNPTISGWTTAHDFPTTAGALQEASSSPYEYDAYITRFAFSQAMLSPSVMPQYVGNSGVVSLTIFLPKGVSLNNIPTVVLAAPGEPDIAATSVVMVDGHHILATFDLTGADPVVRTLVITYPSGDTLSIPQALEITTGGASVLWADIIGFSKIRGGQPQAYYLMYGNQGAIDSQQPFTLWLTFPTYLSWTVPSGVAPTASYISGSDTVLAFDVFDTIPVGGTRVIPITLTLPDLPQYGHATFEIDSWFQ